MLSSHQPLSPQSARPGSLKRSFSEVSDTSNESSFLHGQLTPETSFGVETDQKLPYNMDMKMDPASSNVLEQYQSPTLHSPVPQTDYPQLISVPQLPYHTSSLSATVGKVDETGMVDTTLPVDGSPILDNEHDMTMKARTIRAPRARKRSRPAKTDRTEWKISAPLSELNKDAVLRSYKETENFVNRSLEERMKEVENRKEKGIPRPMNSFLLYRRAFTEAAKEKYSQNNHQIVSITTGESWRLEPPDVRDFFDRMAQIERDNHKKAHPGYKFAPNKNASKKRRKQDKGCDDEIDGLGFDISHTMGRKSNDSLHQSPTSSFDHASSCGSFESRTPTPFDQARDRFYQHPDVNRSSWAINNPGRPVPGVISPPERSHYYQPAVHQSTMGPNIEDVTYRRMNVPGGNSFDTSGALTGLPGTHHELLQPQSAHSQNPVSMGGGLQVDPQLLDFHGMSQTETDQYASQQQMDLWQLPQENQHYTHSNINTARGPEAGDSLHIQLAYRPAFTAGMDGRELWAEDQVGATPVFDDWLNGQTAY